MKPAKKQIETLSYVSLCGTKFTVKLIEAYAEKLYTLKAQNANYST